MKINMIFHHDLWDKMCGKLSSYQCVTVEDYAFNNRRGKVIVIKHDIETNVHAALDLAKIEAKHGLRCTYYFQRNLLNGNEDLIKEIKDMGHEIAYHYDVLDEAQGDFSLAIKKFEATLSEFYDAGFEIRTVCPHGNPLMIRDGWSSNKDFFRSEHVKTKFSHIYDLILSDELTENNRTYISDAGYEFTVIGDIIRNDLEKIPNTKLSLDDLYKKIKNTNDPIIISTHPHRWFASTAKAIIKKLTFLIVRLGARQLFKLKIFKLLTKHFYFIARKF